MSDIFQGILPELRPIVYSIVKAVGEDTRNYLESNNTDTYNALGFLRGDYINTNLRDIVLPNNPDYELLHFKRYAWKGCILINRNRKLTITISSKRSLARIKHTERKRPHYLQSCCYTLNGDLEAKCKQLSIEGIDMDEETPLFSCDEFEMDFYDIVGTLVNPDEGFRHIVVAYDLDKMEIASLSLIVFNGALDVVDSISLMDLIRPDFGALTSVAAEPENDPPVQDAHSLVKIKKGIISKNGKEPEKKPAISAKTNEKNMQA